MTTGERAYTIEVAIEQTYRAKGWIDYWPVQFEYAGMGTPEEIVAAMDLLVRVAGRLTEESATDHPGYEGVPLLFYRMADWWRARLDKKKESA